MFFAISLFGWAEMGAGETRVRIFSAGEFAAPSGWPEDVGIAVITAPDGPEVYPVHARESGKEVLARLSVLSAHDLSKAAVHPAIPGHPVCDLPFSAVSNLLAGVEDFLARFPDAVDEADDFAVNFGFAADEGIALGRFLIPDSAARDATPAAKPVPGLAGYAAFDPAAPVSARYVLRVDAAGQAMVLRADAAQEAPLALPPILLRDDGLGLAVALGDLAGRPAGFRLPESCLPWLSRDVPRDLPLWAQERDGHLLFAFLPDAAAPTPPTPPALTPEDAMPRAPRAFPTLPRLFRRPLWAAAAATAVTVAALILSLPEDAAATPGTATDALRVLMFAQGG